MVHSAKSFANLMFIQFNDMENANIEYLNVQ